MLENLYTTKMSADKKQLQNRFTKIRSKSGKISKLMALIIFAVILLVMACVSIFIGARVNSDEYAMTESEFSEYINRPIGAVMADIDYADDNKLVFHYGEGLFIDNLQTEEIDYAINLKKLNLSYNQQGSSVLEIRVDKGGKNAYLSTVGPADEIKGYEKYIINLDDGKVKKSSMPMNVELFTGIADTFTTVQNPAGWYSNNCIVSGEKTHYLTSEAGTVVDIQLVTIHHNLDDMIGYKYVFSQYYVSDYSRNKIVSILNRPSGKLYEKTSEYLKHEFYRVYEHYYDIQSLTISNWQENGNEATFFYKMTYLNYNREPDTVEYIQEAKKRGQEEYETLYNDYLALKESNYQFKVVLKGDSLELYSNVAPKGTEWVPTKIDDYIMSNRR